MPENVERMITEVIGVSVATEQGARAEVSTVRADSVEAVLRGAGLSDEPGEYDSNIHSWRCEHPERYGKCQCFQDLANELDSLIRDAKNEALEEVRSTIGSFGSTGLWAFEQSVTLIKRARDQGKDQS